MAFTNPPLALVFSPDLPTGAIRRDVVAARTKLAVSVPTRNCVDRPQGLGVMRCYFMKGGHIAAVELLDGKPDDDSAIDMARALFNARSREHFDGFEIWDGKRVVFRYPRIVPKV